MGVVLAGVILGHAAVVYGKLNAVQSQSYGSEARGTAAKSEVIISDSEIRYPKVRKSDILVAMSQSALDVYVNDAKPGSVIILDPSLVHHDDRLKDYDVIEIPAMQTADDLGSRLVSNMVMLGALVKRLNIFPIDALERAIEDIVSNKHLKMDIKALRKGVSFV